MNNKSVSNKEENLIGPWLLTEETLIEFDSLMEKYFNDFKVLTESNPIYKNIPLYNNPQKILTIWFNVDEKMEFNSFKEAIVSDSCSNKKPIKFEYISEVGSNRVIIELESQKINYFKYFVNCSDDTIKNNIIYDMQKIYNIEKPKPFFSYASVIGGTIFLIYILLFLILLYIYVDQSQKSFDKAINNKIYQILSKDDLQQEDYFEIFKYTTIKNNKFYSLLDDDILITDNSKKFSGLFNKIILNYLILGFLFCFIVTLNPKASFAVGKSKGKVRFWKGYYYFLFKFLPIMIVLPIIINVISYFITNIFN
jgi:hypothetical protein